MSEDEDTPEELNEERITNLLRERITNLLRELDECKAKLAEAEADAARLRCMLRLSAFGEATDEMIYAALRASKK